MFKILYILSIILSLKVIQCKEECQEVQTHTFEFNINVKLSFSADIREPDGLLIDFIYTDGKNDRINITPDDSMLYKSNKDDMKYENIPIKSLLSEGWHDISVSVGVTTVNITCSSSDMHPVSFDPQSKLQSIEVSAVKLKICEESCHIEKNVEKIIDDVTIFKITAFTSHKHSITFKICNSEDDEINQLYIKPRDCVSKLNQSNNSFPCNYINPGWNILTIFVNRTTFAINGNIVLQKDTNLDTVSITGNYLVNCTKGTPRWKISNQTEILIPIISGQNFGLSLTSNTFFSPVFNLDGNKLTLIWKNGLKVKFGSSGKPLQPNSYHIEFEANLQKLALYEQKYENRVLVELKIDEVPDFIRVSSLNGDYWISLSIQETYKQATAESRIITSKPLATSSPVVLPPDSAPMNKVVITLLVVASLTLIIILLLIWMKYNKRKKKKITIGGLEYISISNATRDTSSKTAVIKACDDVNNSPTVIIHRLSSSNLHEDFRSDMSCHGLSTSASSSNSQEDISSVSDTHNSFIVEEGENCPASFKKGLKNEKLAKTKSEDIDTRLKGFGKNFPVVQVMEELDIVIDSIFKAIRELSTSGLDTADRLLREHGLPGTVRDKQGNSLLHYLIFKLDHDNVPHRIKGEHIKQFISDHKVFVDALNYKGQTPLHTLVIKASKGDLAEEWIRMAQLLIAVGCNPRVHDNEDQLPEDIALYRGCIPLQSLLRKTRINKVEKTMESKIELWSTLLNGTKENEIESVRQLLIEKVPILPLCASTDPLREAIQRGYIELTMLLLSAGAPLCGRSLIGLNSLEVSHSSPGLTTLLPALIRREFYNCLKSESEMVICNDNNRTQLKNTVEYLSEAVKKDGYKNANWSFSSESKDINERSKEARKMLGLAASIGMGLTCQMIGLEEVFLHPLPLEVSPNYNAKPNTLVVLCRDLELSLSLKESNIPSSLKEEYEEYNFKKLREFCKENHINFSSLYSKNTPANIDVLKYIAEQGMDITYKQIFRNRNKDIVDCIVDKVTGFTMLHSAAYNGRMNMVEYLLLNEANEKIKTDKGFTAAHVAAMKGHKECMEYILEFSKLLSKSLYNDKTNSGLTAHQISNGYASEVNNLKTFLLDGQISHSILSEPDIKRKAKLILQEKKSAIKKCVKQGSLSHVIPVGYSQEHRNIWQQLKEESEHFIKTLIDTDPRFNGKTFITNTNIDAMELLLMDSYKVYLELDDYDYWNEKNLREEFLISSYKVLQMYTVKSKNLCIVPKVFEKTAQGANIVLSYCSHHLTTHISLKLIPVLKQNGINTEGLQLPKPLNDTIVQTSMTHIHVANKKNKKWSYVTVDIEKKLISTLNSEQIHVLSVCRFIKKILNPHWWFPRVAARRHGRQWHYYALTFKTVPNKFLTSCFLWEVYTVSEGKWGSAYVLDRVIGVFKRMVMPSNNGEMVANCILDPRKDKINVSPNILVIIDFLQDLKKQSIDDDYQLKNI